MIARLKLRLAVARHNFKSGKSNKVKLMVSYLIDVSIFFPFELVDRGNYKWVNPYNADIFLYKPWRPKGYFDLKSS